MGDSTTKDKIALDEVRKVAHLARLRLGDEELAALQHDLSAILGYVEKLNELDVNDVPATTHAVELPTALRVDEPHESLAPDLGLRGAPERLGDGFGVPKIIE